MSSFKAFFDAFGYIVLRNLYDKSTRDDLQTAYDDVVTSHFGKSIDEFLEMPKPMNYGVESSQALLDFLQNSRILTAVDELIGNDAVFLGSDLSTFKSGSQFHRDAFGDYHLLKVGIYLQDSTAQDGGQFSCIPGSHIYGDDFSRLCSKGLLWPGHAGYATGAITGEYDYEQNLASQNIPATHINLAVGDIVFFNPALIHSVPANNRIRRMIALTFFEGENSFNSRGRAPGEFTGLTHTETLISLKIAFALFEQTHGRPTQLNYPQAFLDFKIDRLRKYLREFTREQFNEINARVFQNSLDVASRFILK
jgi:ectoine hydroxylase-related dioxygenase (phytanoyl-CoA dioxygenase family)